MLTRSGQEGYRSLGPVYLHLDGASGRLVYEDNPYTDSFGRKLSRSLYPLHSGQVAGPVGRRRDPRARARHAGDERHRGLPLAEATARDVSRRIRLGPARGATPPRAAA